MQQQSVSTPSRSKRVEDALCVFSYVTLLPAAVMLFLPVTAHNARIRFHACQSCLVNSLLISAAFCLNLLAGFDEVLRRGSGAGFQWTARILYVAFLAVASICIFTGREFRVPCVGLLAEKEADGFFKRFARGRISADAAPELDETLKTSR